MHTPPVTVIIPCFNQDGDGGLPPLLARLASLQRDGGHGWEVVFVDDGSTDGTFGRLLGATHAHPWLRVFRHPTRLGVGAALRTGFAHTSSPVVCTLSSDAAYPLERLPELVALIEKGADIATGTTWHPIGSEREGGRNWLQLGLAISRFYRLLTGHDGRALTCPFRAYRREVLDGIRFRSNGSAATAEIILRAVVAGYHIHALPVRPKARMEFHRDMGNAFVTHARLLVLTASMMSTRRVRELIRPGRAPGAR